MMCVIFFRAIIADLLGGRGKYGVVWLGISDREEEGKFVFVDGVVADDSNTGWALEQPDNWQNKEDCVTINDKRFQSNTLNDVDCTIKYSALCERSC